MAVVSPSSGVALRVRSSVGELNNLEVARLRRAFAASMRVMDDRGYQHWAGIYGLPLPMYHQGGSIGFLPWNRAYLMLFEMSLQEFEPGVALPWWDWNSEGEAETGTTPIPPAYADPTVAGESNPLFAAVIDSERWSAESREEVPATTFRELGNGALPSRSEVDQLLAVADFETFATDLEQLHNAVHIWVGGTNASVGLAAYDPFFWAYQASVDRIWWLWQQRHPQAGPPPPLIEANLAPFSISAEDTWDAAGLGYAYGSPGPAAFRIGAASDLPCISDQLNFADYAYAFARLISSPHTSPPLTIGIYGSWGIGKSSLLKMIGEEVNKTQRQDERKTAKVHVVRFNAWQYSSCETIWPSLVREIMETMEREAQWSYWSRFANTVDRNARRLWRRHRNRVVAVLAVVAPLLALAVWKLDFSPELIVAALAAIGIPGVVKLGGEAFKNPVSRWAGALVDQERYGDELPYMQEIRNDLEFLMKRLLGPERNEEDKKRWWRKAKHEDQVKEPDPRVLVMIDDLDRCEPEKAVEVLQAINLLLDFPIFVVCLGIDARVVTAAVEAHYGEVLGQAGASGYEYLDKIVQIPFLIPKANPDEVKGFLRAEMPVSSVAAATGNGVVASSGVERADPTATFGFELSDYGTGTAEEQPSSPQDGDPDRGPGDERPTFDQAEVEAFQEWVRFMRRNPRHIKRLINVYRLVRTLAIRGNAEEIVRTPKTTIAWIVMCAQWPYTVSLMLRAFEAMLEKVEKKDGGAFPPDKALPKLYSTVKPKIRREAQHAIDDEVGELERLLKEVPMTWDQLEVLRKYTLNFNPAIEKALHDGPRPEDSESRAAQPAV
ncbi:MAG: P-loop NTPase fold protein [Solirubrobacterales bacterium]